MRNALPAPFARIPAAHAAFAAEAAIVLSHPATAMYLTVNKALQKSAFIDFGTVPLFRKLVHSGSTTAREERLWLLRLLLAGLRTSDDARVYRRQYIFELTMDLAGATVADPKAAHLALSLLCRATSVPRAARELAESSGLMPWLAEVAIRNADSALDAVRASEGEAELKSAKGALRALWHLTNLRGVIGSGPSLRRRQAVQDFSLASRALVRRLTLLSAGSVPGLSIAGPKVDMLCALWAQVLPLCIFSCSLAAQTEWKGAAQPCFTLDEAREVAVVVKDLGKRSTGGLMDVEGVGSIASFAEQLVKVCSDRIAD